MRLRPLMLALGLPATTKSIPMPRGGAQAAQDAPILVAGAGPTGLVLALELVLGGARVRIIDRASGPGSASRAMAVHARTLELYDRFGLADEVLARGIRVRRGHLFEHGVA